MFLHILLSFMPKEEQNEKSNICIINNSHAAVNFFNGFGIRRHHH